MTKNNSSKHVFPPKKFPGKPRDFDNRSKEISRKSPIPKTPPIKKD